MNTRRWIVAGSVTGSLTVALLIVLGTIAFATDKPMTPELMVIGVVDLLLGMTSLKLLGDALAMTSIERCTNRYVEGVGDTVDRLAEALPKKDNVRRIG